MNYVEVEITLDPLLPAREVLVFELGELGFESFVNIDNGLQAYIPVSLWNEELLKDLMTFQNIPDLVYTIHFKEIEQQNWNAEWERNFDPIFVGDQCCIRAPFHPPSGCSIDVVIAPKMSFGTGHHQTTYLITEALLRENLKEVSLLDMGCGTGVLAIVAWKLGASKIEAIDIEDFAYENTLENFKLNDLTNGIVKKGGANLLNSQSFNLILANINRNILLEDMWQYEQVLTSGGKIFFSGFYTTDFEVMNQAANDLGLVFEYKSEKDGWAMLCYSKKKDQE